MKNLSVAFAQRLAPEESQDKKERERDFRQSPANLFYQQETAVLVSFHRDVCCRDPIGLLPLSIRLDNKQTPSGLPARVPAMPAQCAVANAFLAGKLHKGLNE